MTDPSIHDPQPDRLAVEAYAIKHYRHSHAPYATFAGLIEGVLEEEDMPDAERVAEARLALAALDLVLAEGDGGYEIVAHGPVKPPYGSPERAS